MTVRSSFFEYPGQGGPVTVSVFSNTDEKPDWTGLPSTNPWVVIQPVASIITELRYSEEGSIGIGVKIECIHGTGP